ncbi:MAG: IgGFc-binding protein, partial [Myxococcota bacterium]|nr:IgGFc-binding protein [Myxococcota bacterium]
NGEGVHTNDASLLLPSKVTGQEYFIMSWPHRVFSQGVLRGFATIIATQPGETNIIVKPSAPVVPVNGTAALTPGQESLFTLQQGQALNLETDGDHGADLTGTHVWADAKVSVIGGHECANVPLGIDNCDHLEQQLYPLETWSHQYVADAFKPRSATQVDIWRVMAGDNDVTVTTTPPVPGYEQFKLQRGGWIQFGAQGSFLVEADGPIMVGHYLSGSTYPGSQLACYDEATDTESAIGDPAFTLAVPVNRFLKSYTVLTPEGYQQDYLNIIVPTGASVTIDGAPLSAPVIPVPGTGYGIARPSVAPGAIHFVSGSSPIGLTAYGYDCDVSYAYPGGMKLQAISEN